MTREKHKSRPASYRPLALALMLAALTAQASPVPAQTPDSREYQLKAVFLYNFSKFVTWPSGAFPGPDDAIIIGVLGEDPFGSSLDEAVRDETINGRNLTVRRFQKIEEIDRCNILFVSASEQDRFGPILQALREKPTLTVGEHRAFLGQGGMVNFVVENERVRYDVHPKPAERVGLHISSKLLKLARSVFTDKTR